VVEKPPGAFRGEIANAERTLKPLLIKKLFVFGVGLGLVSGCYSTKMMEFTYQQLDTVKTTQQELLRRVDELSRLYQEDRDGRLQTQADMNQALQELRDALEALGYRVEDNAQLLLQRTTPATVTTPQRRPEAAAADTLGGAGQPAGSAPAVADDEAGRLFQSSYMDLTLGNYDLAVQGFKNYLVRFPGASNAADAHYYLGESYYSLSRFVEAVAEYQVVVKEFSRSRVVAACYLKSGFCYQKLEETELAEKAFRDVISLYPRSEEAEQARLELQAMGG
jgi:tol-pal system protein YbgF